MDLIREGSGGGGRYPLCWLHPSSTVFFWVFLGAVLVFLSGVYLPPQKASPITAARASAVILSCWLSGIWRLFDDLHQIITLKTPAIPNLNIPHIAKRTGTVLVKQQEASNSKLENTKTQTAPKENGKKGTREKGQRRKRGITENWSPI